MRKGHFCGLDLRTASHNHAVHYKHHIKASLHHATTLIARNALPMKKPPTNQPTYATDISIIKELKGDVKNLPYISLYFLYNEMMQFFSFKDGAY